jgi:chaperonin cofactor prefoldin
VNLHPNPDERFGQVESQVLINDAQQRSEKLIERLAEQALQTGQRLDRLAEKVGALAEKVEALAGSQKHTDSKLDALTDIVRQWIGRNGNGAASH